MAERIDIDVVANWRGLSSPLVVGTLHATPSRGRDVFSFDYDQGWLNAGHAFDLDPDLRLVRGAQYLENEKPNFGAFLDSSPDRWGRALMDKREAFTARQGSRSPRKLREVDYLLGVYDGHRMGALRFRVGDRFLDDNIDLASPPWTSLRELEDASRHLEADGAEDDPNYGRWLLRLMAPGRSLGGARPKASVLDPTRALWIAKFPSKDDRVDIGAWEMVAHELARRAGITTPDAQLKKLASKHHTFLSKRFDRDGDERIHFASAMTLLGRSDGEQASYLDLVDVLVRFGAHTNRDLEQLWRRIVFNVLASNVDDHLRNHGFLHEADGWTLAPAYDMNPVEYGDGLALAISESENTQDLDLVRSVAEHFRLKKARASAILAEVNAAVATWSHVASEMGISRSERERMANAFRLVS